MQISGHGLVFIGLTAAAVTACGGAAVASTAAGAAQNSDVGHSVSTPTPTATATSVPGSAQVLGRFRIVGGPYPGINNPLSGQIVIHVGSITGDVLTTVRAHHGRFVAQLPVGSYVFAGKTRGLHDGPGCTNDRAVAFASGQTKHVTVQCDVP